MELIDVAKRELGMPQHEQVAKSVALAHHYQMLFESERRKNEDLERQLENAENEQP